MKLGRIQMKKHGWINDIFYIMSCYSKTWVPLLRIIGYISYAPVLVTRQFGGIQYMPRTLCLTDFTGLFRNQSSFKELELIRQD